MEAITIADKTLAIIFWVSYTFAFVLAAAHLVEWYKERREDTRRSAPRWKGRKEGGE